MSSREAIVYPTHDLAFLESLRSNPSPCSQRCTCEKCGVTRKEEKAKSAT